jgi:RNA polymerase sigma-70 factor (ECF subfamily)
MSSPEFLSYYVQYYDKIYRYLYFRSYEDPELAQDLTSETFLKAFEKLDTFNPEFNFSTWLYAIARNTLVDHFRKKSTKLDTSIEDYIEIIPSTDDIPNQLDKDLKKDTLLKQAHTLPEKYREIILLKYFNDYSNEEISEMLDLNTNTIRVTLHRAIKMLREKMPPLLLISLIIFS